MQFKQLYNIAIKVSSRKSATTVGDLPDCCIGGWVNNRDAGDLKRHRTHNHVIVMSMDILL